MALIVEDGSNVPFANTYQSVADLRLFAAANGIKDLPEIDEDCEPFLLAAMNGLVEFTGRWQGDRTYSDQALPWPRKGVRVDGMNVDPNSIPYELKYAQLQLSIEAKSRELQPNKSDSFVTKQKVGPIETTYENKGTVHGVTAFSKPMAQISLLLKRGGLGLVRS
jgi:hypothetical protein